jgi:hypothetical protein
MTLYAWDSDVTILVEFAFDATGPLDQGVTWTDIAAYTESLVNNRGRSSARSEFDAGTATITLNNVDGRFDPTNAGSPYAGGMNLGIGVRIRATHNAVTYPLYRGMVASWPLHYPLDGFDSVATVECSDLTDIINRHNFTTEEFEEEMAHERVESIMSAVGWAVTFSTASSVLLRGDMFLPGSALNAVTMSTNAEAGAFFIGKDGTPVFHDRIHMAAQSSQATFNPGVSLDYRNVGVSYDKDLLINHALITAGNEERGEASDTTSITAHGESAFEETNEMLISEPYATNLAEWMVGRYKDVKPRITSLTIAPEVDPADLFPEVLDRELRDLITVTVNPPGSGTNLTQVVGVEGIRHTITPEDWETVYTCHPLAAIESETDYWILGTSDDLDTDTVLA